VRARVLVPLYAALAAVLTWPLVAHLTTSLPYGTEPVATVPLFNLWTLRWNQIEVGHLFRHYWDAPLFHPTTGAFALSEPQPLTGVVAFTPLAAISRNPVLAYNLVLLGALVLNGLGAHRLARTLGVDPVPAATAGALAVALPFVGAQMGVLQLAMVFPIFFLIDAILRWAPDGGRRRAAMIGVWLTVTFLTCGYYGLFAAVVLGPASLAFVRRRWFRRERALDVAVALGTFAVLALPIVLAQASITVDYRRSKETILALSAELGDFWRLPAAARGAGVLPWISAVAPGGGHPLYPGTVLLVLAVAGIAIVVPPAAFDPTDDDDSRRALFLLVGTVLAWLLSLGLNLEPGGWQPYDLLRRHVPGFASLRSPFRADVMVQVFLVAFAALALDAGWRRLKARGAAGSTSEPGGPRRPPWVRLAGPAIAFVLVGLAVLETGVMPVRMYDVDRDTPDWAAYLADHPPPGDDDAVIAFLPFPPTGSVVDYLDTVNDMLAVLERDGATTVNGYSGLFPASYDELEEAARAYPNDETDELFRRYGVTTVVADRAWLAENPAAGDALEDDYRSVFTGPRTAVYERR
jgi:hypothetical protein